MLSTLNLPSVNVPVLSKYILSIFASLSKYTVPLARIPLLLAAPIPTKKPSGIDITKAQGQDITKKFNALYTASLSSTFNINGNNIAINITTGVYILQNLEIYFSVLDLFLLALFTSSIILDTALSFSSRITSRYIALPTFILPAKTSFPLVISTYILSPFNADISNCAASSCNIQSKGTLSPVLTNITSPTFTSSVCTFLPSFKVVSFIFKSNTFFILSLDESTALSCNNSPILYNTRTAIPSVYCPIIIAPIVAIVIIKFSSNISFPKRRLTAFKIIS